MFHAGFMCGERGFFGMGWIKGGHGMGMLNWCAHGVCKVDVCCVCVWHMSNAAGKLTQIFMA